MNYSEERLYYIYSAMKRRCTNPNDNRYHRYGGRGIKVCEEWKTYLAFREWAYSNGYDDTKQYGECTLDRIDVDGNYEPNNCRWVNEKIQANNRSSNRHISCNGETHTLSEWSDITGIDMKKISERLNRGLPIDKVLSANDMRYDSFNKPKSKKVMCVETKEIFPTMTEAAIRYGVNRWNISSAVDKDKLIANYHWRSVV